MTLADTELIRARWRRAREPLEMLNPLTEGFARGGLGGRASPSLRVVVLPADPEQSALGLGDEFWEWWKKVDPSPPGTHLNWGHNATVAADGTFRGEYEMLWERYIAVRRHGGVDLGADVVVPHADKAFVPLLTVVALVWSALRLQWMLRDRLGAKGPWEVSVGLRDIGRSLLAQYANGWEQPLTGFNQGRTCDDPGVLMRRELSEWPADEAAVRDLAFDFADLVEQCWGIRQRVFLVPNGEREGEFDGPALR